ncbi:abscisic acid receptor PYL4-like [Tasmannia lanceolata]|uniref:abscisic acid receptor PYL4-like n=1 Tax=Tasmannia lanceolata TaxID=3420 RepID=UPI00406352C1
MPSTHQKSSLQLQRIINTNTSTSSNTNTNMSCQKQSQISTTHHHHSATQLRRIPLPTATPVPETVARHHTHSVGPNQCCSAVVQPIAAPLPRVWSVVRRFDNPQAYKHFIKSCHVIVGTGDVGTLREVRLVSGIPAGSSTERLEILDDERHVLSFSVVGGDHRLANYRSITTLHPASAASGGTVVVESYVVDVPPGNSREDTCVFVDTIVKCNLQSLAQIAENSMIPPTTTS